MTTLVIEELETILTQDFTATERLHINAIRPYLYVHNFPAGLFLFQVLDAADNVVGAKEFLSQEIYDGLGTVNAYAHAFFKVEFDAPLALHPGNYTLKLSATGYSFSESSYMGWVKEYENQKVNTSYLITGAEQNPLSYELWSYER